MLDEKGIKIVIEGYVRAVEAGTAEELDDMNVNFVISGITGYDIAYNARECLCEAAPPHKKDWPRKLVMLKDAFDWQLIELLARNVAKLSSDNISQQWVDDLIQRHNPTEEEG